jgi:cytochrome c oxidase subunit 2
MKKWMYTLALLLVLSSLSACGASEEKKTETPAPTGNEQIVDITASNFKFNETEYKVEAGKPIKISFQSEQGAHAIAISGTDIELNDDDSEVVTLEAGEYNIICSIPCGPGHSEMVSKLIVS